MRDNILKTYFYIYILKTKIRKKNQGNLLLSHGCLDKKILSITNALVFVTKNKTVSYLQVYHGFRFPPTHFLMLRNSYHNVLLYLTNCSSVQVFSYFRFRQFCPTLCQNVPIASRELCMFYFTRIIFALFILFMQSSWVVDFILSSRFIMITSLDSRRS